MLAAQTNPVVGTNSEVAPALESATRAQGSKATKSAIRAELEEQVSAWNRGDLKGYMQGYWHSQELTFFAGSKESAGWESAYQRYRTAYLGKDNKDKQMGKLTYTNLRIEVLSPESAFVRGGWQLTTKDGSKRAGLFTVVLRKFSEGWRIIHDHSS
jgi:beta-aspartyl-peptidase (threonine type)